jgi:hypothetical protein
MSPATPAVASTQACLLAPADVMKTTLGATTGEGRC